MQQAKEMDEPQPTCSTCRWVNPKFRGVNICKRPWSPGAGFWPSDTDKGEIFVVLSHSCIQWEKQLDLSKDVL